MKTISISAAVLAIAASTASAQMTFDTGSVDLNYYGYDGLPGISSLGFGVRGAYSIGQLGLQFDGSILSFSAFGSSIEDYSAGIHLNKQLGNGTKIGVHIAADNFTLLSSPIYAFGAEGMVSFGSLEVEAAITATTDFSPGSNMIWIADIDAYYEISRSLELNIGTLQLFSNGLAIESYSVGLNYSLSNIPLTVGASYLTRQGNGIYNISASYAFGPKSEERLFSSRQYPLYIGF